MSEIRVQLRNSHAEPVVALYAASHIVRDAMNTPAGPSMIELARLKARAKEFLELPLIQGLNEDGL